MGWTLHILVYIHVYLNVFAIRRSPIVDKRLESWRAPRCVALSVPHPLPYKLLFDRDGACGIPVYQGLNAVNNPLMVWRHCHFVGSISVWSLLSGYGKSNATTMICTAVCWHLASVYPSNPFKDYIRVRAHTLYWPTNPSYISEKTCSCF